MAVRAKFRCNSVEITRASAQTDEFEEIYKANGHNWGRAQDECKEKGIETSVTFDQPTVKLSAVVGTDDDSNKSWAKATPSGNLQMTITNPPAAEFFELGKFYYLDFSPAE